LISPSMRFTRRKMYLVVVVVLRWWWWRDGDQCVDGGSVAVCGLPGVVGTVGMRVAVPNRAMVVHVRW
jgi:hypothetical protein